ncbi:MAG: type II toxin-antitoxin system prevent-host-death family antitoxin [Deltaproteobacteria bacterium]|nr:type II toxin-antitoxin system prevent-host-death family antitoxin [Deltaproteobacteria bacterium]
MVKVNVAMLKSKLSRYLDMVQFGEQIMVTSHGKDIAKIQSAQLVNTAPINWTEFKHKFPGIKPKKKGMQATQLIRKIRDEN